jgi:hypothetical protein
MRGRVAKSVPQSAILVPFLAVFVRSLTVLIQNFPDLAETCFKPSAWLGKLTMRDVPIRRWLRFMIGLLDK